MNHHAGVFVDQSREKNQESESFTTNKAPDFPAFIETMKRGYN